jgi:sugar (pentulose or hexulose) kinase
VGIEDRIYFDGGPALNKGLVAALQDELQRELVVPEHPQTTTAFGAAILARGEWLADQAGGLGRERLDSKRGLSADKGAQVVVVAAPQKLTADVDCD